jgi:hypothetical protein
MRSISSMNEYDVVFVTGLFIFLMKSVVNLFYFIKFYCDDNFMLLIFVTDLFIFLM